MGYKLSCGCVAKILFICPSYLDFFEAYASPVSALRVYPDHFQKICSGHRSRADHFGFGPRLGIFLYVTKKDGHLMKRMRGPRAFQVVYMPGVEEYLESLH